MKKFSYSEPVDYIPKSIRKKNKVGEFYEDDTEKKQRDDANKKLRDFVNDK